MPPRTSDFSRICAAVAPVALGALATGAVATALATDHIERRPRRAGRLVVAGGVRWRVLEAGEGPPVLLLHGNAVTAEDWVASGVFARLARGHSVIAPDRPGCGWSSRPHGAFDVRDEADALAALLDLIAPWPVSVIAHSIGVQVALWLAIDRADLVRSLTLASGYAAPTFRFDSATVAPLALPGIGPLLRTTLATPAGAALTPALLAAMFAPHTPPKGFARDVFAPALRPGQMRASAEDGVAMATQAERLVRQLSRVTVPALMLAGGADVIVSPRQSEKLAAALPKGRALRLEGVGHMLHHAAPEAMTPAA